MEKLKEILCKACRWIGGDGFQHICVSALIMVALGWIRPLIIAMLITFAAGIGKEIYDYVHPEKHVAQWKDVACDLIGIALGSLLVLLIKVSN